MCILLSMVLNAAYMLWCMHVSIILWSVLHKQTPLRFGASDFGETPVWGMKFSWNSGSFVLRWSGVKFWYIRMKMTLEPEYHFKTSNQYDTDGIAGPKRRKCRRHIWSWVMCCVFFSPSWLHGSHFRQWIKNTRDYHARFIYKVLPPKLSVGL